MTAQCLGESWENSKGRLHRSALKSSQQTCAPPKPKRPQVPPEPGIVVVGVDAVLHDDRRRVKFSVAMKLLKSVKPSFIPEHPHFYGLFSVPRKAAGC